MTDSIDTSRRALTLGLATALLTPASAVAQATALGNTGATLPVSGTLTAEAKLTSPSKSLFLNNLRKNSPWTRTWCISWRRKKARCRKVCFRTLKMD